MYSLACTNTHIKNNQFHAIGFLFECHLDTVTLTNFISNFSFSGGLYCDSLVLLFLLIISSDKCQNYLVVFGELGEMIIYKEQEQVSYSNEGISVASFCL
jgi:hypothetical protein